MGTLLPTDGIQVPSRWLRQPTGLSKGRASAAKLRHVETPRQGFDAMALCLIHHRLSRPKLHECLCEDAFEVVRTDCGGSMTITAASLMACHISESMIRPTGSMSALTI